MPRDSGGTYTLPAGNPVVTGTIIESVWANDTMEDFAVQMNNVLTRDGLLGPTQAMLFVDGTEALPGIAFALSPSTGLYRFAPNVVGMSVGGDLIQSWSPTGTGIEYDLAVGGNLLVAGTITGSLAAALVGNVNASFGVSVTNNNAGTTAAAGYTAYNNTGKVAQLVVTSSGFTALPAVVGAEATLLFGDGASGIVLSATHASGSIRFSSGGFTERMRLTAAGNFGIGVNPALKLHVVAALNEVARFDSTAAGGTWMSITTSNTLRGYFGAGGFITGGALTDMGLRSEDKLLFATGGGTERMRIDSSGRVGIAMAPVGGAIVDIKGLLRTFNESGSNQGVRILNSTQVNGITIQVQEAPANLGVFSSDTAAMTHWVGGTERMRIDTSGNVGIGATSAGYRLHVAPANAQGGISVFNVGASTSTPLALTNGADADFHVVVTGVGAATKQVTAGPSAGSVNAPLVIQTVGVERMRFGIDGLVVINRPTGAVIADGRFQVHDAAKVPNIAFVKNSVQGWYVGGDKSGATNRFDISANGGPVLTIQPGNGFTGLSNITGQEFLSLGAYADGLFKEMAVYGPYGNAALANAYFGMVNGNGGGKVELNGHTGVGTLASWQILHHSDIAAQDLIFRYSPGGATRSAFAYSERFRISAGGNPSMTNSVGSYYCAIDPGPAVATIPIGAIVFAVGTLPGGSPALSGLGTYVASAGNPLTWGPYTGGATTTTITYGTWRNIGAQAVGGVGLWIRVA